MPRRLVLLPRRLDPSIAQGFGFVVPARGRGNTPRILSSRAGATEPKNKRTAGQYASGAALVSGYSACAMTHLRSNIAWFGLATLVSCALFSSAADAAPPWVSRGTNLPRGDWAFDPGLGFAYSDYGVDDAFGVGLNLEAAVGVLQDLEIGLRTGLRLGNDGRLLRADEYGRLFDRQTFGTDHDSVANPEVRVRGRVIRGEVVELALEGRAYLPIEDGSRFGMMLGIPILLHLGSRARIDTGLYLPILFRDRTETALSIPIDLWFQATSRLWLGPMSGVRYYNRSDSTDVALGFGLGYQLTPAIDLKTMLLFPGINHREGARHFGGGVALQLRIE
jgi:hypothetical protein